MKLSKLLVMFLALIVFTGAATHQINAQDKKNHDKKVEKQHDDDDDDDKYESPEMQNKLVRQAKISKEEAQRIALERVAGEVVESEIDKEKGKIVWEFEIKTSENKVFEVAVDAKTGEIVAVEDETNEADDDHDDPGSSQATIQQNKKWFNFWKKIPLINKL